MSTVSLALASLFLTVGLVASAPVAPGASTPEAPSAPVKVAEDSESWLSVGVSESAQYDVLKGSVRPDVNTFSVQFIMRTKLKDPIKNSDGTAVNMLVESSLALCVQDTFITLNQIQYGPGEVEIKVVTDTFVYQNSHAPGQIITKLMSGLCGDKRRQKRVEPNVMEPGVSNPRKPMRI